MNIKDRKLYSGYVELEVPEQVAQWLKESGLSVEEVLAKAIEGPQPRYAFFESTIKGVKRLFSVPDRPLRILKAFRWFVPRQAREDLDIVIADLEEDMADIKAQKRSRHFIFTVLLWHLVRTLCAYLWAGALDLLKTLLPFLRYFTKG